MPKYGGQARRVCCSAIIVNFDYIVTYKRQFDM